MKKSFYWAAGLLLLVLAVSALWWITGTSKDPDDPINRPAAFVASEEGMLQWFELENKKGKIEGTLVVRHINDETTQPAFIDEKIYQVTGKETEKGYELTIGYGEEEVLEAWMSGDDLSVKKLGQPVVLYKAVNREQLKEYEAALEVELERFLYDYEYNEQQRIKQFFDSLRSVYGYANKAEGGSLLLFIQYHEALYEGELSGSMIVAEKEGTAITETEYEINGITNGNILELFATVDGESTKLEGNFQGNAKSFDLTFWKTDKKHLFQEVTKEEYDGMLEEFKAKINGT